MNFCPHYFVDVFEENSYTVCQLGSTHHGIKADASEVMGELGRFIEELKANHPEKAF